MEKNIFNIIKTVLNEKFDIDKDKIATSSDLINDLGIDSFGLAELVFELKEKMGIEIKKEDLYKIHTVKDIADYIRDALKLK